jgi:hypothetical protein
MIFSLCNFFVSFFASDFLIILNCFLYFLFLIATVPKRFFASKKMKEEKRKEMKKNEFFFIFA